MAREKFETLTEQMFYILLNLKEESMGVELMERISNETAGRVQVGPGTLYNLLDEFTKEGFIVNTKAEGRKKYYILAEKGKAALKKEYERLTGMIDDFKDIYGED
ncbi:MAG: PadR family transcriptional regulator [Tissierellia bacterium]|nr:PadR family transcriptional regulator [Tissierellia bacterium]